MGKSGKSDASDDAPDTDGWSADLTHRDARLEYELIEPTVIDDRGAEAPAPPPPPLAAATRSLPPRLAAPTGSLPARRTAAPATTGPAPGEELSDKPDRYRIERILGVGGMGVVFSAHGAGLDRPVAIKVVGDDRDDLVERFDREARIAARLQHPSIVPVYGIGRYRDGRPFYAMKKVAGQPLDQVIARSATLEERLALLPNLIAVADAIAYTHSQRVVHRDLKPHNILVGEFGETVVIDWGLAKDLTDETHDESVAGPYRDATDTAHGKVMGTPAYMPLEQARGEPIDERADVYALGAILYHMMAGAAPYARADEGTVPWESMLARVLAGPPPPLSEIRPDAPADLVAIVAKAMAPYPEHRYPSASELAADLRRFQTGQLVGVHRYSTWELVRRWLRRHRTAVIVGATALLALIVLGLVSVQRIVAERNAAERERRKAESGRLVAVADGLIERDPLGAARALLQAFDLHASPDAERVARKWSQRRLQRVLPGVGIGQAVACSEDGKWVATQVFAGRVRLWSTETWRPGNELKVGFFINHMRFSPDGTWLAFAGQGSELAVWRRGDQLAWHESHRDDLGATVVSLTWSPDSRNMVLALSDGRFLLREPGGSQQQILQGETGALNFAAYSPDGKRLAVVSGARLGVLESDGKLNEIKLPASATTMAWTNGALLVAVGDGRTMLWEPGKTEARLLSPGSGKVNGGMVTSISSYGSLAAIGSADGTIDIFGWEMGQRVASPIVVDDAVTEVAWSPARFIASASTGGNVRIDDPAPSAESTLPTFKSIPAVWSIAEKPGGGFVAVGGNAGQLMVGPLADDTPLRACRSDGGDAIMSVAWSPDGTRLAAPGKDGGVHVWRVGPDDCQETGSTPPTDDEVFDLEWSPDGADLVVVYKRAGVSLWHASDLRRPAWKAEGELARIIKVTWDERGRRLVGAVTRGIDEIAIWTPGNEQAMTRFPLPRAMQEGDGVWTARRPHSDEVAVVTRAAALFDPDTGQYRWISDPVTNPAEVLWSPDGARLAVVERGGSVKVLDPDTGEIVADTRVDIPMVFSAAWIANGIIVGGEGFANAVVVTYPPLDEVRAALRSYVEWADAATTITSVGEGLAHDIWTK